MTEAKKKAKKKYRDKGKRLTLDFYPSEAALIDRVESQPNKQGYIKGLIRADSVKPKARFDNGSCTNCGWFGDCVETPMYKFCPDCGAEIERGGEDAVD